MCSRFEGRYPCVKGSNYGAFRKISWEQVLTCLAHSKEHFKSSLAEHCGMGEWGGGGGGGER